MIRTCPPLRRAARATVRPVTRRGKPPPATSAALRSRAIESLDADVLDVSAMTDAEVHAEWTAAGGTDADIERMLATVQELLAKRRAAWRARGGRP